ncbi:hypothetical protein [Miniphocaeibacter massiliensis]|uniref:hypothetical protein n=1 Tax=Miniphocaeibacter massiliensis TaxID=2041841 RepID=UPI000C1C042B|nr:hypothetical protein [Miniphocaeibacter massiliensis]
MNQCKVNYISALILGILQLISAIFFAIMVITGLSEIFTSQLDGFELMLIIALSVGGISCLISATDKFKLASLYKEYVRILEISKDGSITRISNITKTKEIVVICNLQKMIKKRYFTGAEINVDTKRIIFNHTSVYSDLSSNIHKNKKVRKEENKVIICQKCGGENLLDTLECEYCGSKINGG